MVTEHVTRSFGFLKTTAIGGIFFLLPFIVISVLLGQVIAIVQVVAALIAHYVPSQTPGGYALLFLSAVALLLLACFICGVLARRALMRKFTQSIEKYLLMLFPRYSIFKEQLSGNIGGEEFRNRLIPVSLQFDDFQRIAFEVDRIDADAKILPDRVIVYLPGSPDPWNGTVILMEREKVARLEMDFLDACGAFETLGQQMKTLLQTSADAPHV